MWRNVSAVTITAAALANFALAAYCQEPIPSESMGWKLDVPLPTEDDSNSKQPAPGIVPRHLQPLGKPIPMLWVNEANDATVVSPQSRDVWITFSVPTTYGNSVYLRIDAEPFGPSSCPVAGTQRDVGNAQLEATDKFRHPLRSQFVAYESGGPGGALWSLKRPPLKPDWNYYVQGCVIGFDGRYTGVSTNTVTVELVTGLPDLIVNHAGVLRRTDPGKIYFAVSDRIPRSPRVVRGTSIDYRVSSSRPGAPVVTGTAPLTSSGFSWVVTEFRIPDDGALHEVIISINMARAVPETNFGNNASSYSLRVRATPAVIALDRLNVRENCDGVSPGDWNIGVLIAEGGVGGTPCVILSTSYIDIDDRAAHPLGIGFEVVDLPQTTPVYVEVRAFDCDRWTAGCGEEAHEAGGRDDYPGLVSFGFNAADRASGAAQTRTSRDGDCGENAFTATVRYLDRSAADATGVRIVGSFDVSGERCEILSPVSR